MSNKAELVARIAGIALLTSVLYATIERLWAFFVRNQMSVPGSVLDCQNKLEELQNEVKNLQDQIKTGKLVREEESSTPAPEGLESSRAESSMENANTTQPSPQYLFQPQGANPQYFSQGYQENYPPRYSYGFGPSDWSNTTQGYGISYTAPEPEVQYQPTTQTGFTPHDPQRTACKYHTSYGICTNGSTCKYFHDYNHKLSASHLRAFMDVSLGKMIMIEREVKKIKLVQATIHKTNKMIEKGLVKNNNAIDSLTRDLANLSISSHNITQRGERSGRPRGNMRTRSKSFERNRRDE